MEISASQVKALREQTGAGMMDCKKALVACQGDSAAATKWLEDQALVTASKKSDRIAAEGLIVKAVSSDGRAATLVEINSQTDFVARNEDFIQFAEQVAVRTLELQLRDVNALLAATYGANDPTTIEQKCQQMIAKIGENLVVRRCVYYATNENLGVYVHNRRIGVIVEVRGGDEKIAKDMAMQIAASNPIVIHEEEITAEFRQTKHNEIAATLQQSDKPANVMEQMVQEEFQQYLNQACLLRQAFILDPTQTVAQYLNTNKASIKQFTRLELGEGIEKATTDFAQEVMAQMRG
jgi:elongation factor Ts